MICEAAVVAMPHPRLGETGCLFAVVKAGVALTLADIVSDLADIGLAKQKFPERFVILGELPKTPSGKVRKDLLREAVISRGRI